MNPLFNFHHSPTFEVTNNAVTYEKLDRKVKSRTNVYERTSCEYKDIILPKIHQSKLNKLKEHTKKNVLFLTVLSQFNIDFAKSIVRYFQKNYTVITPEVNMGPNASLRETGEILLDEDSKIKGKIKKFMMEADLGIVDMYAEKVDSSKSDDFLELVNLLKSSEKFSDFEVPDSFTDVKFKHLVEDCSGNLSMHKDFSFGQLSTGTKKIFELAGSIFHTLETGGTLIIDEIENQLHHMLIVKIISLFNSIDNNKNNANLIITSHDLLLLDEELRRDQIWFIDKSIGGKTTLYNISKFPNVTKKHNILKQYLLGIYRSIPDLKL